MTRRLRGSGALLAILSALWLALFTYFELIAPYRNAAKCHWGNVDKKTNVMLVADPQLIDGHTYPERNRLLLKLSQHTVDVYLKQNYKALVNQLKPDYIMFLGDYLDNGRLCDDNYYEIEFLRFEKIFNVFPQYVRGKNLFTSVPGNHDVGFGNGVKAALQARFASHFGKANTVCEIEGVDFIMLDSPSLSSQDPEIRKDSLQFLELLSAPINPRVLLSHVPLFRDTEKQPCGPHRERNPFLQIAGYQYQLALDPDILEYLLNRIRPQLIFAGDDHDYCAIVRDNGAREYTVKSISMAMGIQYPAVQLLSFAAKGPILQYDTHMCYLPSPYVKVFAYLFAAIFSSFIVVFWNIKQRPSRYGYSMLPLWGLERTSSDLSEEQEGISQNASEYMASKDKSSKFVSLPSYAFTPRTWEKRYEREFFSKKQSLKKILNRWNVLICLKHMCILGVMTLIIYNLVIKFV